MPFHESNSLRYFSFESFEPQKLTQGIFTRHGGVSPEPWGTLNQGGSIGDPRENVIENRRRVFAVMGRKVESIFDVWQVHGNTVVCTDQPRELDGLHQKADAILTDRAEITLFMRFADCVPIFLYDPARKVIGIVHAGWQGTVKKVVHSAIDSMVECYQSNPADVLAGIGPSIGQEHYPVGEEVVQKIQEAFGADAGDLLELQGGQHHLDLWAANRLLLEQSGVRQIEVAGICTACNTRDWYSYRAEKGKTGRFGAILALQQNGHR
ncbi:MAG: peptidoglycan editing factor PgeF [Chloroflexi bacterium]|nr:peptidoglycan editing factor PgeF [Anaerolineaceae bacterium]NMB88805.1 peptidoglycan editing factor PgeF [Chloroflexota bacterium]